MSINRQLINQSINSNSATSNLNCQSFKQNCQTMCLPTVFSHIFLSGMNSFVSGQLFIPSCRVKNRANFFKHLGASSYDVKAEFNIVVFALLATVKGLFDIKNKYNL